VVAQQAKQLPSIYLRHHHIEDDQAGSSLSGHGESAFRIASRYDAESRPLDIALPELNGVGVVLDR
jgi:hypothetical protein